MSTVFPLYNVVRKSVMYGFSLWAHLLMIEPDQDFQKRKKNKWFSRILRYAVNAVNIYIKILHTFYEPFSNSCPLPKSAQWFHTYTFLVKKNTLIIRFCTEKTCTEFPFSCYWQHCNFFIKYFKVMVWMRSSQLMIGEDRGELC